MRRKIVIALFTVLFSGFAAVPAVAAEHHPPKRAQQSMRRERQPAELPGVITNRL